MTLKLFLLKRSGGSECGEAYKFVVCAKDEKEARAMASKRAGGEGKEEWTNPHKSSCEILEAQESNRGIIIRDYFSC